MHWPRRLIFALLLGLIGWGVVLFALGMEVRLFEEGQAVLARALSFLGTGDWLALLVLQEVKESGVSYSVLHRPSPEKPYFEVEVVFESRERGQRFIQRMEAFLFPFRPFGLRGEHPHSDFYQLLWGDREWFRFHLRLRKVFRVAIVIDDIGYDHSMAEKFFLLPVKLNVSLFPHLPGSARLAQLARERGKEVLIHLPMEAIDPRENSGERFLLRSTASREEVVKILEEAFRRIPQARGLSNHKGSKATQNWHLMEMCASVLREKGVYFLDSVTTSRSVAFLVMEKTGVPSLQRDVFLDGEKTVEYVLKRLHETLAVAKKRGFAVAIGHPERVTYEALRHFFQEPHPEYEFVFLSEIAGKGADDDGIY